MPSRKVLLDECVSHKLIRKITGHTVTTVQKAGWKSFRNGNLLGRAQVDFDILITTDRNLSFQRVGWGEERTPTWSSETSVCPGLCWGSFLTPTYLAIRT
uniref:DUF5615 domain-containing protein n=1 Tax=Candidatus Kentrum sp. DK TaxID=2126562 RepID=A0A450SW56_9GAMM|nr:MAG: hypothetical protein BECKDK2373B_GA0170837_107214 [Candidatus Kentron sp. DK]